MPSAVPNTGLEVIVNANWPLYRDATGSGAYYLLSGDCWLTSGKLDQGWKAATSLPRDLPHFHPREEYAAVRKAVPLKERTRAHHRSCSPIVPTELIVTEGKPALETIPGASGLEWVTNTESPLFKLESNWYLLVAGRWFTTTNLDQGRVGVFEGPAEGLFGHSGRSRTIGRACIRTGNGRGEDGGARGLGAAKDQGQQGQPAGRRRHLCR